MTKFLPKRLKELRKLENITLRQLSKIVNITQPTLSRYERGERNPKVEQITALAKHFNVSVPYLQGITDDPNGGFVLDYSDIDALSQQLGDELSQLAIANDAKAEVGRVYDELIKLLDGYNNDFNEAVKIAQKVIQQYKLEQLQNGHPES